MLVISNVPLPKLSGVASLWEFLLAGISSLHLVLYDLVDSDGLRSATFPVISCLSMHLAPGGSTVYKLYITNFLVSPYKPNITASFA